MSILLDKDLSQAVSLQRWAILHERLQKHIRAPFINLQGRKIDPPTVFGSGQFGVKNHFLNLQNFEILISNSKLPSDMLS